MGVTAGVAEGVIVALGDMVRLLVPECDGGAVGLGVAALVGVKEGPGVALRVGVGLGVGLAVEVRVEVGVGVGGRGVGVIVGGRDAVKDGASASDIVGGAVRERLKSPSEVTVGKSDNDDVGDAVHVASTHFGPSRQARAALIPSPSNASVCAGPTSGEVSKGRPPLREGVARMWNMFEAAHL